MGNSNNEHRIISLAHKINFKLNKVKRRNQQQQHPAWVWMDGRLGGWQCVCVCMWAEWVCARVFSASVGNKMHAFRLKAVCEYYVRPMWQLAHIQHLIWCCHRCGSLNSVMFFVISFHAIRSIIFFHQNNFPRQNYGRARAFERNSIGVVLMPSKC